MLVLLDLLLIIIVAVRYRSSLVEFGAAIMAFRLFGAE